MISQSILDMINDATGKAYILTALEYAQNECKSHADFCKGCFLFVGENKQKHCFFTATYFNGSTPEEWDLDELTENFKKGECQ